jgi:hypothetical protein
MTASTTPGSADDSDRRLIAGSRATRFTQRMGSARRVGPADVVVVDAVLAEQRAQHVGGHVAGQLGRLEDHKEAMGQRLLKKGEALSLMGGELLVSRDREVVEHAPRDERLAGAARPLGDDGDDPFQEA